MIDFCKNVLLFTVAFFVLAFLFFDLTPSKTELTANNNAKYTELYATTLVLSVDCDADLKSQPTIMPESCVEFSSNVKIVAKYKDVKIAELSAPGTEFSEVMRVKAELDSMASIGEAVNERKQIL